MALPNFRLEIKKRMGAGSWSNDYYLQCASMDEAEAVALALITFERNLHSDNIIFEYWRASTMTVGDRIFRHRAINGAGLVAIGANAFLPLYCTVRVDFTTADTDPARKFYRLPVWEASQTNGQLDTAVVTNFQTIVNTHFVNSIAMDNVVTSKGNVVTGAQVYPFVQERQLRRRKRYPKPEA